VVYFGPSLIFDGILYSPGPGVYLESVTCDENRYSLLCDHFGIMKDLLVLSVGGTV